MKESNFKKNGRPFNYFEKDESDIHKDRIKMLAQKVVRQQEKEKEERLKQQAEIQEIEKKYWDEMDERIGQIREAKEKLEAVKDMVTRKFLICLSLTIQTVCLKRLPR